LSAAGAGVLPAAARQAPGSPGLASAVDRNWTQECMGRDPDQDLRQDNKPSPLQKLAMDKDSETLMILQL